MEHLTLQYWQDGPWYVGRLRERPEVMSQGQTLEELSANIKDALELIRETDLAALPQGFDIKEMAIEA